MQDSAESGPSNPGADDTLGKSITIPIHGGEESLEAIVRELMKKNVVSQPTRQKKSKIAQAIRKERAEDTPRIRNEYLVSSVSNGHAGTDLTYRNMSESLSKRVST